MRSQLTPSLPLHITRRRPLTFCLRPIRVSPHKPLLQCRHFSPIEVLDTTQSLILGLHSTTGLPWYLTVPLLAIILRLGVTLPFTLYAQTRSIRTVQIAPVLQAWQKRIAREEAQDRSKHTTAESFTKAVQTRFVEKRREIAKRNGIQYWKGFVGIAVQLPVWIIVSLSLRRMSAIGGGIGASWFPAAPSERISEGSSATAAVSEEPLSSLDASLTTSMSSSATDENHAISDLQDTLTGSEDTLENLLETLQPPSKFANLDADLLQSLQTEGIPHWCPNLLELDPTTILPILFASAVFANIEYQTYRRGDQVMSRAQTILRNVMRGFAILILPLTLNMESFILLYWAPSAIFSLAQNVCINQILPLPEPVKQLRPKPLPLAAKLGGVDAMNIGLKSMVDEFYAKKHAAEGTKLKQDRVEEESRRIVQMVGPKNKQINGKGTKGKAR